MRYERKKGISTLVAAMFMILITVAGAIMVYVYASGILGTLQGAQPQQPYAAQITLEYYDWTNPTKLIMWVRNVGSSVINLEGSDWLINGVMQMRSGTCSDLSTFSSLLPQGSCKVTITTGQPAITSGVAYTVKIATPSGSVFSYSCVAGGSNNS